ncbi:N-acyl-D-amino-acid deacylase family protein [Sphingomonas kyeonggiensis]|uniref:N-acyl-D-aspartate/D-glutamate deacylase n=1 Tax=Sphingomonas kyeonggiensis TaxID=1268553 RepID=A0A7W6JSJ4_9SPHN|nr:amidohydrolase family protein [Sphingomonas kyeonggiensis]MBB4098804.1 N-acyl-D-aspartate/D-glutamate deacylase [Sphingomonas kyeonggiensis]
MKIALLLGIAAISLGAAAPLPPQKVDLLIRGGTIYTGSDAPFIGDVAIKGDHIVSVSRHANVTATRIIDAKGMIVAPGFIDPHTHMGEDLASDDQAKRLIPAFLMQGVTTAFIGNDGGGDPDVTKVLGSASIKPVGINYAAWVGFGAIREKVVGEDNRAPTSEELAKMKGLVASAMCQGALGLSTGLFYAPQSFAKTEEVIALAKEAGKRGGSYDSHIRDESSYTVGLVAAIDEAIRIGREGGLPAHISHIKALGVDVQGQAPKIIAMVEAARARGEKVTANQYPWSASGTSLVASLVPLWAQDGGRPALLKRFDDPSLSEKMHAGMVENLRKRGGADKLLVVEGKYRNRYLDAVAKELNLSPVDAAIAVIRIGDPGTVSFNQSEADIAAFMRQPWVMTGSDASGGHPRVYGSFARKYDKYVKTDHVITLRQFIERSSSLTADTFGLTGRGHLRSGAFADVVVFDPKTYASRATYEDPAQLAAGVQTVVVNGVVAVDKGAMTGKAAGRALAHKPTAGSCN